MAVIEKAILLVKMSTFRLMNKGSLARTSQFVLKEVLTMSTGSIGSMALALAAGIVIGVVFQSLKIPSPAPPFLGLLGLAGMFVGQRLIPWIQQWLNHK
jgi:XapX domain-containing protein